MSNQNKIKELKLSLIDAEERCNMFENISILHWKNKKKIEIEIEIEELEDKNQLLTDVNESLTDRIIRLSDTLVKYFNEHCEICDLKDVDCGNCAINELKINTLTDMII